MPLQVWYSVFLEVFSFTGGSYNLEKVLNFTSRLEKSLNLVSVLKKYFL